MSIVRENLMSNPLYRPYCGSLDCSIMPRTVWLWEQFQCPNCGWKSRFEPEFIEAYKAKWSKE